MAFLCHKASRGIVVQCQAESMHSCDSQRQAQCRACDRYQAGRHDVRHGVSWIPCPVAPLHAQHQGLRIHHHIRYHAFLAMHVASFVVALCFVLLLCLHCWPRVCFSCQSFIHTWSCACGFLIRICDLRRSDLCVCSLSDALSLALVDSVVLMYACALRSAHFLHTSSPLRLRSTLRSCIQVFSLS